MTWVYAVNFHISLLKIVLTDYSFKYKIQVKLITLSSLKILIEFSQKLQVMILHSFQKV